MCITRAIVHALDTFPRINWPRNYEMCRFQRATMARELRGEANPEREREIGGSVVHTYIRPSRYDPERIRRIPRIHYARVTPVHRVCDACCVQPATCAPPDLAKRGHIRRIRGPARADPRTT